MIDFNTFVAVDALKAKKVEKDTFFTGAGLPAHRGDRQRGMEGAILVGYCTGMRLQNVANLRWNSIDTENGLISFVERKGDKPITIGLHPDLAKSFAQRSYERG